MEYFLPELMTCADAMKAALDVLKPHFGKSLEGGTLGTIVLGTIQGDLHDLADKVYQAGLELFLELGVYCRNTSRLIQFSRDEVEWALKHAPTTVTYGLGRDLRVMTHRTIEDSKPPFCLNTPVGCTVAEERFVAMVQSYAQEPLSDTFSSAFSQTVQGRPIKSGTPQEVEAAIWNVVKLREAARAAGRPQIGIHNLISNAERTDAIIAAVQAEFGVQPNDGLAIAATAEMKVDYERMKKVVFLNHKGLNKYGLYGPIMGGYAGGPEATAIVHVAHHFLGLMKMGTFPWDSHRTFKGCA
jgi:methylamine--corrinoid protein Co-methyltransferase